MSLKCGSWARVLQPVLFINNLVGTQGIFTTEDIEDFCRYPRASPWNSDMMLEKVSEQQGEAGAGIGMGLGFMMPAMFTDFMKSTGSQATHKETLCPDCKQPVTPDAKFCPFCGHQILVFQQCSSVVKTFILTHNSVSGVAPRLKTEHDQKMS